MESVVRPLWRPFAANELRAAAKHALAGGIAVVEDRRWYLLGDAGPPGEDIPLLVDWAIRAVEAPSWREVMEGPARGCVKASIASDWRERVGEWIERDRAFKGATTISTFDCMKCAACCHDNMVELDEEDLARFRDSGDRKLMKTIRTRKGKKLLPLVGSEKACVHLSKSLTCRIYEHRPSMCREFPAGCEQCLTSREEVYGEPFPAGR